MPANNQSTASDNVFVMSRVFNASRAHVWAAWSEAEQMQAWWGPKGATIRVAAFEFRPGGFFHYGMQYSNGPQMWGRFMYRDIAAPERIVWLNSFSNEGCGITRAPFAQPIPLEIHNEVTFKEQSGKTTVTLRARPHGATEEEREVFKGMFSSFEQGYGGTLDQLAAHLTKA
ncbi:MAG: SRPBCC domain-containing protein [Hyphomicrobiaceae bacterium]